MTQQAGGFFTRDYQIGLIAHLAWDEKLFRSTLGYLELTDVDMEPCRLVLETLQDYFRTFNKLPDFATLSLHIQCMLRNPSGQTQTILMPEDYDSLAYVMAAIANTRVLNSDYYQAQLPNYIKAVRVSQEIAAYHGQLSTGQGSEDFVQRITALNEQISRSGDIVLDGIDENPEAMLTYETFTRVPTVLTQLNKFTSGGLGAGETGMIVACPGVGKTTGLINFMNGSITAGWRSLFLTCELKSHRIKHRYHTIAADIPAQYFKIPVTEWPAHIASRYQWVLCPDSKYFGYNAIVDMSERRFTISDVEQAIRMWLEDTDKRHGEADICKAVYVDWLDRLDPSGLRVSKSMREDQILTRVSEGLGELARKYNVALWTATQGTRQADGKDILRMSDTAWGYHKNDAVDVSLGIGVTHNDAEMIDDQIVRGDAILDDDDELAPPCDRHLVMSIMKNRDNPEAVFNIYQGATLRLYDNDDTAGKVERQLREGKRDDVLGMHKELVNRHAPKQHKTNTTPEVRQG